jgi:hypothetical protein
VSDVLSADRNERKLPFGLCHTGRCAGRSFRYDADHASLERALR